MRKLVEVEIVEPWGELKAGDRKVYDAVKAEGLIARGAAKLPGKKKTKKTKKKASDK